ncbi:MAG: ISL3 family transposase [Chitinophagia bacterium]|nr:ISL3 family transposase [Chitinophagia bacterium]
MKDNELYQYLLGLESPWTVKSVALDIQQQKVDVRAEHPQNSSWPCPKCGCQLPVYDHSPERTWRHLDSCQFKTYLHASIPRVNCQEHGVTQVDVPWAKPHSRFTLLFERLAIDVLKQCTIKGATSILRISWDEAYGIMGRAVERGLKKKKTEKISYLGIDEKALATGHKYMTLVYNLNRGIVEYVTEDRKQESLKKYYEQLDENQLGHIQAVAMDMWEPFIKVTEHYIGSKKIVIDRFHVMKHLNQAVDIVRKQENRELEKKGDNTLKGSKYLWLYSKENIPLAKLENFEELIRKELRVGKAWSMKETFRELWKQIDIKNGTEFFLNWWKWVYTSEINPIKKAAKTVINHIDYILNYFANRITNAVSEGLNSKIQKVQQMACGYRNAENFKIAIYFHCGGLELYP